MRLFRALLWLYPASWRNEYGAEMCAAFARRRADASRPFGRLALWLETIADLFSTAPAVHFDFLRQDLRYAVRTLGRSPGFAATAIAIAALGIGATTAAFTMVDHVLLRPLPFPAQDRLVKLAEDRPLQGSSFSDTSPANYRDWRRLATSFDDMAAWRGLSVNLSGHGEPELIEGASVTAGVLPLLGIQPALGRLFTPTDDRESAGATVILSYALWQAHFGADSTILGRTIELDDVPYTVIGVMPAGFYFPNREALLWTAMRWRPADFDDRTNTYIYALARLKRGVPLDRAQAEMHAIGGNMAAAFPKELAQSSITLRALRDDVSPQSRVALKVLLGAALCVLLIGCTNLANLLLARAIARRRELAVRTALGAGRERLVRQMLTESLMLAIAGGALGLLLAYLALPLLVRLVPTSLPIAAIPSLDGRVLLFATLVTCATGVAFGLIPALRSGRGGALDLHEAGRSGLGVRHERLRSVLVVTEVAGSVVLLAGFGLLTRALWRIQAVDPGFRPEHVLTLRTSLPMPRYEALAARAPFYRRVLEETRRLPGVTAAAYISFLPMVMRGGIWPVEIAGHPQDIARRRWATLRFATPGFFQAMGIPLLEGRDIRDADTHDAPWVAVVSNSFVRRYWPGEDPIGRHFNFGDHDRVVVGVAGDIRVRGLERSSEPQVYLSWQQPDNVSTWYAPKDLVVRTTGDPLAIAAAVRRIVRAADPSQPISDLRTLTDIVEAETSTRRVQLEVLGVFAGIAFLLAAVGIHGLLLFAVSMRTREIGVRVALGAKRRDILGMTLRDGFRLAGIGIAVGGAVAMGSARVLEALLAGVRPDDLATFAAACTLPLVMTLAGSLVPVMRALRVDPAAAIRAE